MTDSESTYENKEALRNMVALHVEEYLARGGKIVHHSSADNRGAEEDGSVLWKQTRTRESNLAERKRKDTAIIEAAVERKKYQRLREKSDDNITAT